MSFFYQKKKGASSKPKSKPKLIPVHLMHERECGVCYLDPLENELGSPKLAPVGPEEVDVYILGPHPSLSDDDKGKHFSGESSSFIRGMIPGKHKRRVRYNYISRCRPLSDHENKRLIQTECCRPSVERDIEAAKPKIIIGIGNLVLRWALGKGGDMNSWRGRYIPLKVGSHLCWFVPTYEPSFVYSEGRFSRKSGQRMPSKYDAFFKRDIANTFDNATSSKFKDIPWLEESEVDEDCDFILGHSQTDLRKLRRFLQRAEEEDYVGLDLETTALRPYSNGRILSCSVTTSQGTLAFPLEHKRGWRSWSREAETEAMELFEDFIFNSKAKIWHNLGFDMEWLQKYFGHDVFIDQRYEDTMIMAYLLDSRKGMLNLDTLTRIHLGVWLKEQSDVDRAALESEPLDKLLRYNAMDTKIMYALFFKLKALLDKSEKLRANYNHMLRTANTLVLCQDRGLVPDNDRLDRFDKEFNDDLSAIEDELYSLTLIKRFKRAKGTSFSPTSSHDVSYLFDKMLSLPQGRKYKDSKKKTWSYSTDEACLTAIKKEVGGDEGRVAELLLRHRGTSKMLSTYITATKKVTHSDGLIHTNYSQIFTATGRLNSSDPNCFPPGVEYLTENGWIDCAELEKGVAVAQVDLSKPDMPISFAEPINYIEKDFDGKLCRIKSSFVDVLCTDEHRFHIKYSENDPYDTVVAKDYPDTAVQPMGGTFYDGHLSFDTQQIQLGIAFNMRCFYRTGGAAEWTLNRHQHTERCIHLLEENNIAYKTKISGDGCQITVAPDDVPEWLKEWHLLDTKLLRLCSSDRATLVAEMHFWDTFINGKSFALDIKSCSGVYQALLAMNGPSEKEHASFVTQSHKYTGKVYCLTMPHDTLIIRCNGKVLITGQSQNYPKRKNKHIREIIKAPYGHHIASIDYGQIEARVFAMASKDKAFMDALWTGYDVHQAWALKLIDRYNDAFDNTAAKYDIDRESFDSFADYEKKVIKTLRGDMKNGWVFPQFFGSSPYSCATNLNIPSEIAEKMADEFWQTFTGVKRWQEKTVKFYERNGYVETLTGKRRYGPLGYNEIINTPIQGTAATIVVDALTEISEMALYHEDKSHIQPSLCIHDDITLYLPDKSIEDDIELIVKTMVTPRFDFINVPLVAEVEIGEDWGNQYVYGEYSSDGGWVD